MHNIKAVCTTNMILWLSFSVAATAVKLRQSSTWPPTTFAADLLSTAQLWSPRLPITCLKHRELHSVTSHTGCRLRLITSDLQSNHRKTQVQPCRPAVADLMWLQPYGLVGVTYFTGALWILVFVTTCFYPKQLFKQLLRSATLPNSTDTPWWQSLN